MRQVEKSFAVFIPSYLWVPNIFDNIWKDYSICDIKDSKVSSDSWVPFNRYDVFVCSEFTILRYPHARESHDSIVLWINQDPGLRFSGILDIQNFPVILIGVNQVLR